MFAEKRLIASVIVIISFVLTLIAAIVVITCYIFSHYKNVQIVITIACILYVYNSTLTHTQKMEISTRCVEKHEKSIYSNLMAIPFFQRITVSI